jgi:hypothetical protein
MQTHSRRPSTYVRDPNKKSVARNNEAKCDVCAPFLLSKRSIVPINSKTFEGKLEEIISSQIERPIFISITSMCFEYRDGLGFLKVRDIVSSVEILTSLFKMF